MKKYLFGIFCLLAVNIFSAQGGGGVSDDTGNAVIVNVTAVIGKPITLEKIQDINFGEIIRGTRKPLTATGKMTISASGNVKLEWKDKNSASFQPITEELKVPIYDTKQNSMETFITLKEGITPDVNGVVNILNGTTSSMIFEGKLPNGVSNTQAPGEYSGQFTVRATYE